MQGAGGLGSIARLIVEAGARPRAGLRSGQIVRANVIKQLAPSKWMLGIGGRTIAASAERTLTPGMSFLAQVRIESGTILLQPYSEVGGQAGALRFLAAEGLPQDDLSVTILRALLRSGMPLDPARIRSAYAFFRARDQVSARQVRAYLIMQQKGIEPSADALDRFVDALDGFSGRGDSRRGGEGGAGHRGAGHRGDGHGEGHAPPQRRGSQQRSADETVSELATRREDDATDLLHAFNHLDSGRGHWVVIPFSVEATAPPDTTEAPGDDASAPGNATPAPRDASAASPGGARGRYHGSIRLHFAAASRRFDRAAVSAEGSAGRWELELVPGNEGAPSRLYYPGGDASHGAGRPPADLVSELSDRLSALGFGAVIAERNEDFDGFSTGESLDILKGIDTEA